MYCPPVCTAGPTRQSGEVRWGCQCGDTGAPGAGRGSGPKASVAAGQQQLPTGTELKIHVRMAAYGEGHRYGDRNTDKGREGQRQAGE